MQCVDVFDTSDFIAAGFDLTFVSGVDEDVSAPVGVDVEAALAAHALDSRAESPLEAEGWVVVGGPEKDKDV